MSRVLLGLISLLLILALSGCAGLASGAGDEADGESGRQASAATRAPQPTPEPTKPPLVVADLLGTDGRLTVLILGSDAREGIVGSRTDTIIVATIDPTSGKVAMVSLPRDTVNVPIAPGNAYAGRINSLFWEFERASGKTKDALKKTKAALAYAFDTEIDYYVMLEFDGLVRLLNGEKGLRLKAGKRLLDGKTALAFSRSRHSDSDYERASRQQQVVAAAAEKVRSRGLASLPALVELAGKKTITDIPLRAAPALFELAMKAKLASPKSIVLAPGRWARELPGTYTITPRVLEVQKMFDKVFDPLDG